MLTSESSEEIEKSQENSSESAESSPGKIIDFFVAREVLRSDARSAAEQAELQRQIEAAVRHKSRVHLYDPWEDILLLLSLIAAVVLGLLVISGFG
jgi:hypothetical protein